MKKSTIKQLLNRIKPYSLMAFLSLVFAFLSVVSTLVVPKLIGDAIDEIASGNIKGVVSVLITVTVVSIFTMLVQFLMNVINNELTFRIVRDLRNDAFLKIEKLPLKFIDSTSHGKIVSNIITDADQVGDGLLMGFTQAFSGIITIIGTLIFMFRMNFSITLVVVILTPLSMFIAWFVSKNTFNMFTKQSEVRGELTAYIDEMLVNEKLVKTFSNEEKVTNDFTKVNNELGSASLKAIFFSSLTNPGTRFVYNIIYGFVALTGAFSILSGNMSVGVLTSFLSYTNQYTKPFNEITSVITELQNAFACLERILDLIALESISTDEEKYILKDTEGRVECRNVCFSYSPDKKLIENFNLSVAHGQRVAIVGPTGCGKTTFINLLMRFYGLNSGAVTVDDIDIADINRKSLRKLYGMVLQDTWLRSGTIKENIIMGKPDATDEEIIEAAKKAHSHSFIRRLKNGYDTVIGEDGGSLSAGQKQLLCITRIMLSLPPMLILDEATSSIDTRTEQKIQNAFEKLMEGKTSFIIAHRLSTIKNADIIVVMRDGHIVETGNHDELLNKKGFYYNLYNSQYGIN